MNFSSISNSTILPSIATGSFSISATLISVEITPKRIETTAYFNFTLNISLYANNTVPYLENCIIYLESFCNNTNEIQESISVVNGLLLLNTYLTNIGNQTIVVSANNISGTAIIVVNNERFIIYLITSVSLIQPSNNSTIFTITIGVYDYQGLNLETSNFNSLGAYSFMLTLYSVGSLTGLGVPFYNIENSLTYSNGSLVGTTSGGTITLYLQLISYGSFVLKADPISPPQINTGLLFLPAINDVPISVNLTADTYCTVYFNLSITITIWNVFNQPYDGLCNITIIDEWGSEVYGTNQGNTYIGNITLEISFKTVGWKNLSASCQNIVGTLDLYAGAELFSVSEVLPIPEKSTDIFSVTVLVTDLLGNLESIINNPEGYIIELGLIPIKLPNSPYSGIVLNSLMPAIRNGGIYTFNETLILSSGSFYIYTYIINESITYRIYPWAITIANNIANITASASILQIYTYFLFNIQVSIIGDDNNPFIQPVSIILSTNDSSLNGNLAAANNNGTAIFSVYFTNNITNNINITIERPYPFYYNWNIPFVIMQSNINITLSLTVYFI